MKASKTRVLLVDDHLLVREGLRALIERRPGWEVCGEAATGLDAVAATEKLTPDIVVMDISMPDLNGIEATRRLLKDNPKTDVLILSMHESEEIVREVLACGARGYVLKNGSGEELLLALEGLRQHHLHFTPRVTEIILHGYLSISPGKAVSPLTPREREIVQLIAEGKSNKDVAAMLCISVKTVETHRARINEKLDVHSPSDLVRYAIRNRIIES